MGMTRELVDAGVKVIDLAADFRIKDVPLWEKWYGMTHATPELVAEAVYGLPEMNRAVVKGARVVANPGCYPTAVTLGFLPLVEKGLIETGSLIADAKSGVSGAGRKASVGSLLCEVEGSFKAYGVPGHRHLPEIRQILPGIGNKEVGLTFVPHLVPMVRLAHDRTGSTRTRRLEQPRKGLQSPAMCPRRARAARRARPGARSAIGLSLGANTLLHMAHDAAERVQAMVIVAATTHYPEQARAIMRAMGTREHSEEEWRLVRSLRYQGRADTGGWLEHARLGFNYRMDDIRAAIGIGQREKLDDILAARASVAGRYASLLAGIDDLGLPCPDDTDHERSWFVYVVTLPPEADREAFIAWPDARGVQTARYLPCIHLQAYMVDLFQP